MLAQGTSVGQAACLRHYLASSLYRLSGRERPWRVALPTPEALSPLGGTTSLSGAESIVRVEGWPLGWCHFSVAR